MTEETDRGFVKVSRIQGGARAWDAAVLADVDGTLREPNAPLDRATAVFLQRLVKQGVMVVPSSGRAVEKLVALFGAVGVFCPVYCGENGGHLAHHLNGKWQDEYSGDVTQKRRAEEHLAMCRECNGGEYEHKRRIITIHFGSLDLARKKADIWEAHLRPLMEKSGFTVMNHPDGAVDFIPRGVSKTSIARFLMGRFEGMPLIAAGDGVNDIPMLQGVPITPVCPGNAHPDVVRVVEANGGRQFAAPCAEGTIAGIIWALARHGIKV